MRFPVIPSEARNPSSIRKPGKEGFLTPRTPFGMTGWPFFRSRLVLRVGQRFNHAGQLYHFNLFWALGPIVPPTDNCIATIRRVAVVAEIPALKFKFDTHALPPVGSDLPHSLTVRESFLNGFDEVAQFFGQHPKQEQDTLFVGGFVAQPAEVDGVAISSAIS